jgi:agmatine/peptidylarginine deiminase
MSDSTATWLIPEWANQSAVFLAWPYAEGDFSPWLAEVEATYIEIVYQIQLRERVLIAVRSDELKVAVESRLLARGAILEKRIILIVVPYNDVWVRDSAPLSVKGPMGTRLLDFRFNGWGDKYDYAEDAKLAGRLYGTGLLGVTPIEPIDFVLEGGSVESDGLGSIMTTSRCLLNPNRNPSFTQNDIEVMLKKHLGSTQILWLDYGHAEGDDTDAHIDTLARFCSDRVIAYTACIDPQDPLFEEFERMAEQLGQFTRPDGEAYELIPLPMPKPILSEDGQRLPATYANFLIINGAVLVPVYGDPQDDVAIHRLQRVFQDREIVPIDCVPLIRQYGSLHCMTMQFPEEIGDFHS